MRLKYNVRVPSNSVLAHLLQPKVVDPKPPGIDVRDREQSSRLSALSNFSIGDVFAGGGSKSTKFPERLLKVLEQKLQDVAMGKDAMSVIFSLSRHFSLFVIGIPTNLFGERWESFTASSWWTPSNVR